MSPALSIWPFSNIIGLYRLHKRRKAGKKYSFSMEPHPLPTGLLEFVNAYMMFIPVIFFVWLMELHYPIANRLVDAAVWDLSLNGWMFKIWIRDLIFSVGEITTWYFLVEYAFHEWLKPLKFNPENHTRK